MFQTRYTRQSFFYATDFINNSYYIPFCGFVNPFIINYLKKIQKTSSYMHSLALNRHFLRISAFS